MTVAVMVVVIMIDEEFSYVTITCVTTSIIITTTTIIIISMSPLSSFTSPSPPSSFSHRLLHQQHYNINGLSVACLLFCSATAADCRTYLNGSITVSEKVHAKNEPASFVAFRLDATLHERPLNHEVLLDGGLQLSHCKTPKHFVCAEHYLKCTEQDKG